MKEGKRFDSLFYNKTLYSAKLGGFTSRGSSVAPGSKAPASCALGTNVSAQG
jgi:hypothetical protein